VAFRLLILAAVLIAGGIFFISIITVLMGLVLIRPRRMTDGRALAILRRLSPADLGMEFEECVFEILDESTGGKIRIAAWWIPLAVNSGKCAILIHGYADAKVGAIAWAPMFRELGYNILAFDLRAHGQSGGLYCTGGFHESRDLMQIIDQLKAERGSAADRIILFGVSLGATVAAAAGAQRSDLSAVILESPHAHFAHAAGYQADRMGMPGPFFQRGAFAVAQWIAKCNFDAVRPTGTIPKIQSPLMVISAGDDQFVRPEDLPAIQAAVEKRDPKFAPSIWWFLPQAYHVLAICENPLEYQKRIGDFLEQAMSHR
jgi:uncharacterized protein